MKSSTNQHLSSSDILIVDIETTGTEVSLETKIICVCAITLEDLEEGNLENMKQYSLYPGDIKRAAEEISKYKRVVFHNGASFDYRMLQLHYPKEFTLSINAVYDTLCASRIRYPELKSHSLDFWSEKMGVEKVHIDMWESPSIGDLLRRCTNDVVATGRLYMKFSKEVNDSSVFFETEVLYWHAFQEQHGVYIDLHKATKNYKDIYNELAELEQEISKELPWRCLIPGFSKKKQEEIKQGKVGIKPVNPFLKSKRAYTSVTTKYFGPEQLPYVQGEYTKVKFQPYSLTSADDVREYLLSIGWKPTSWNYTTTEDGTKKRTTPKLTEDSFDSIPHGLGQKIVRYRTLKHRLNFLYNDKLQKGAIIECQKHQGRVRSYANTCGTPTARYRHGGLVCNVPRPSSPKGKEIREIFSVPDECVMIGGDLKSIEARVLAHYISRYPGGEELAAKILSPKKDEDFHTYNASVWGVSRDTAKSGYYALIYGCGTAKLAATLGKPTSQADELYNAFWTANQPIASLIKDLQYAYKKRSGKIVGLDGRLLYVRGEHKLLNTLLQNAATMVFKMWLCMVNRHLSPYRETGVQMVIAYHDELQFEVINKPQVIKLVSDAIQQKALEAGEYFKLTVPTPADVKVGSNWAETH